MAASIDRIIREIKYYLFAFIEIVSKENVNISLT